jgi:hypothetical protein
MLEVLREVIAPIWYKGRTLNPTNPRTRPSMMVKEILMERTRTRILPTSRRRLIRRKGYVLSVVILIIGLPIDHTTLTSMNKGR